MSKQLIIILIAIFLVGILAIGGYFLYGRNSSANKQVLSTQQEKVTETPAPTVNPSQTSATKGSLLSLMSQNKNVTCQISYPDEGGTGTIFVSGNKFMGDFTTTVEDKEMKSHVMSDGEYAYMWTEGSKEGTKFTIQTLQTVTPPQDNQAANLNKEVEMDCSDWTPDDSKFSAPKTVKFSDMTQMMKQMQDKIPAGSSEPSGMPKIDKSICEKLTNEEAKEACLKAAS